MAWAHATSTARRRACRSGGRFARAATRRPRSPGGSCGSPAGASLHCGRIATSSTRPAPRSVATGRLTAPSSGPRAASRWTRQRAAWVPLDRSPGRSGRGALDAAEATAVVRVAAVGERDADRADRRPGRSLGNAGHGGGVPAPAAAGAAGWREAMDRYPDEGAQSPNPSPKTQSRPGRAFHPGLFNALTCGVGGGRYKD